MSLPAARTRRRPRSPSLPRLSKRSLFEATGHAAAVSSLDLVARVPGFVQEIGYTDGAFVKKGTPLFTIEPEPYGLKMETAKSVVSGAEAKLRQAEADFKRQAELMAEQSTAASVYDRALAQLDTARTELQSARAGRKGGRDQSRLH